MAEESPADAVVARSTELVKAGDSIDDTSGDKTTVAKPRRPRPTVEEGRHVGRYRVGRLLGEGAMGQVFAAHDPELEREVALKLVAPDGTSRESYVRLLREAQTLAMLSHPNIVPVYDTGRSGPWVFIAMKLVRGPTLKEWMRSARRDWTEVLEHFLEAGRGLAAAHGGGIVHRDFKPGNVVLDADDGRAVVLDFGLARVTENSLSDPGLTGGPSRDVEISQRVGGIDESVTRAGTVMGTPAYMAPEQHRGKPADARSDQFSFCVSLFEALYGQRPFAGENGMGLAEAKANREIRAPRDDLSVPARIRRVVERGLEPGAADRWPDMTTLLDALAAARRGRRWGGVALVGAGLLLVGGYWRFSDRAAEEDSGAVPDCGASGEAMARVWSPQRREAVERALADLGPAYAAEVGTVVLTELDGYAREWEAQQRALCEQGAGMPGAQAEAKRRCLLHRLDAVEGLVAVLVEADTTVLPRAPTAVEHLPTLEECARDRPPEALVAVPPPNVADEVEAIRKDAQRASALGHAGRFVEQSALVEPLVERAAKTEYKPVIAEVASLAGRAARARGDSAEALTHYERAMWTAVEAGDDALAADVAVAASLSAIDVGDIQGAETWARNAASVTDRLPYDPHREAVIEKCWGHVALAQGKVEEAERHHANAQRLLVEHLGPKHSRVATAMISRADALRQLGRAEEALELQLEALGIRRATRGPGHPDIGESMINLAGSYYALHRLEEAKKYAEESLAISEASLGPSHPRTTMTRGNVALVLTDLGEYRRALELTEQVIEEKRATMGAQHEDVAIALHNYGKLLGQLDRHRDALAAHREALDVWRQAKGADHPNLAYPLSGIGNSQLELGDSEAAREAFDEALRLIEAVGEEHELLFDALWGTARTHAAAGDPDAQDLARRALATTSASSTEEAKKDLEDIIAGKPVK